MQALLHIFEMSAHDTDGCKDATPLLGCRK